MLPAVFFSPSAWRIARKNIQQESFMHRLLSRVLCNHRKRWSCKEKKVQNVLQICHFPPHFPKKAIRTRCAQMSTYSLAHLKDNTRFREASFTPAEIAAFEAFPEASESHCSDLLIFYTFSWIILKGFYKKWKIYRICSESQLSLERNLFISEFGSGKNSWFRLK